MEAVPEHWRGDAPATTASPPGKYCLAPFRAGVRAQFRRPPGGRSRACKGARRGTCSVRSDRKSTRLNSSHLGISYAVFCLKKKKHYTHHPPTQERLSSTLEQHRALLHT